jgi:hypothetical protein
MAKRPAKAAVTKPKPVLADAQPADPQKPWGTKRRDLPLYVMDNLYEVYPFLDKETRARLGLMMKIPVFIQDPLVALEDPLLGVQEIEVRLENGLGDGPTSSRLAVVDFNADTQVLNDPVSWDRGVGWFREPQAGGWLPDAPPDTSEIKNPSKYETQYRTFIENAIHDEYFHQLNVWGVVQRVLEFYEDIKALGRPIPWGFDGNRLLIVPHAGYGENAYYDQRSKSLQFYYFGDVVKPGYTCLSHDIIAHETGHAVLDGIRPLYNQFSSVQTSAFHEFIGDLTAIMLALFNNDIRHYVSQAPDLQGADVLANLAEEFGRKVEGRPYLRSARNQLTLEDVRSSVSPHLVSQVLTGAMFEILIGITQKHLDKNVPEAPAAAAEPNPGGAVNTAAEAPETPGAPAAPGQPAPVKSPRKVTPAQALWWAAERFRMVALQPLDLCPPCDIQFLDYARAVLRNNVLIDPVDEQGYRGLMLDVFHQRKLCSHAYQPGEDLPEDCLFYNILQPLDLSFVNHDIGRVSRSRTAAYYFLSDNRKQLRIPLHQDVVVCDLYDNNKLGAAAERLPREVVLEYTWKEKVMLTPDANEPLVFGSLLGKTIDLYCGGTLVFDDRGNLLSWLRKPGTEHITNDRAKALRQQYDQWQAEPLEEKRKKIKLTKQELGELDDYEEGVQRKKALKGHVAETVRRGLVDELQAADAQLEGMKPVAAIKDGGSVRLETRPHLRDSDFDKETQGWTLNY